MYTRNTGMRRSSATLAGLACALALAACKHPASMNDPERLYAPRSETALMLASPEGFDDIWARYSASAGADEKRRLRNEYIAMRMYAIDMHYTEYESALLREVQAADFGTDFTNAGLNLAGGITGGDTARVLSVVATGMTGINNAYAAKILRAQLIHNLQAAMRIGRNKQAVVILANSQCPVDYYPLGMALSDLEAYYRAGTFQSGLVRLAQTVMKEEEKAKAGKDDKTPGAPAEAQAVLAAAAVDEAIKANSKPKCDGVAVRDPLQGLRPLQAPPGMPRQRGNRPVRTTPLQELDAVLGRR